MKDSVAKKTNDGWYVTNIVLTILFGYVFTVQLPKIAVTIVGFWVRPMYSSYVIGSVGAWLIIGWVFLVCLRRMLQIHKARRERKEESTTVH